MVKVFLNSKTFAENKQRSFLFFVKGKCLIKSERKIKLMKKRRYFTHYTLKELIKKNKEDIINDRETINNIEKRIEDRHIKYN
jgi:Fur-regulated basic protein B